ncbi:MAG: TonB-dependent receptor [Gammaproteobacteria bacterium]|nr:TonB-dependent receptor [Gammaproteobacteria bacterium]
MFSSFYRAAMAASVFAVLTGVSYGDSGSTEEMVVTAAPLGDVLQSSQVLSGEELMLKSSPTLGETLSNEPGISSTYFGPAASRPIIRGLSGSRVQMLSDSISTLDVSDVSPDHAVAVEPLLADQIEIIRGPATLLYGSSAAGGVINVSDNRIPEATAEQLFGGAVEVRGDTAAEERAYVGRIDGGWGEFAYHIDGFRRDTDNIDIKGFATADPAERPAGENKGKLANSYSESDGVAAGLSWVTSQGYLGASISKLNQTYGLPGPEEEDGGGGDPEIFEGPFLDMEQTRIDVRGEYRFDSGIWESIKLAYGNNDYEHNEIEPSGEVATEFENDAWQIRTEAVHSALAGWRGAVGFQYDDRDFSAVGEEAFLQPTSTESWGVFLLEERDFDFGSASLGARAEFLEHDNDTLADYDDTALSLGAGLGINTYADSEAFINLSYTERNPGAEELYSEGAHIATRQYEIGLLAVPGGSVNLEKSTNVEIGWRREAGDVQWEVSAYFYDIADYVYQDLTGAEIDDLPVAQYSQEDAEFLGFEAALVLPTGNIGLANSSLRLFGDYVDAELDGGEDLPRIPPWRTGANFLLEGAVWQSGLDVIYHAEQNDISSFNTSSYTMLNLNGLYRFDAVGFDWELFAKGTNLLDEDARKSTSFLAAYAPLPGRSFHLGLRARF